MKRWIRTCQECGHSQIERFPPTYGEPVSNSYANRACHRCKSEPLDYGSEVETKPLGKVNGQEG